MSVFIIAEAGVNHNGDINLAKKLADVAKDCGADAIKFQTFKTEKVISRYAKQAKYQVENTGREESQYDMVKRLELSYQDFLELKRYCDERNIMFISTPDDIESLHFLCKLKVPLIKLGSTEITNLEYLREVARRRLPIIMSTGMSTLGEVETALNTLLDENNSNITLLHCTTDYPTEYKDVNIQAMVTLREAFKVKVGYSDHTLGSEAAIAAVALGARVIEKHFTLDKNMEGPDHIASLNPDELREFIISIRKTEALLGDGIKRPTEREKEMMKSARRSIVAAINLDKGTVLERNMLEFKRPGNGISPSMVGFVVGRRANKDIFKDQLIKWEDI